MVDKTARREERSKGRKTRREEKACKNPLLYRSALAKTALEERRKKNEQRNEETQRQHRYSITSGISSASKLYAKCTRRPPSSLRVTAS